MHSKIYHFYEQISGKKCADRHWEKSKRSGTSYVMWGARRIVAMIEYLPIIGALAATIDRICNRRFSSPPPDCVNRSQKCIQEHAGKRYIKKGEIDWRDLSKKRNVNFANITCKNYSFGKYELSFSTETEDYALAGIFDSHGRLDGERAIDYATTNFSKIFDENLEKGHSIPICLKQTIAYLDKKIKEIHSGYGCSALISYIEKATGLVYTATLGDHEANIYREFNKEIKSIPLSQTRTWKHQKECQRGKRWIYEHGFRPKTWVYEREYRKGEKWKRIYQNAISTNTFDHPKIISEYFKDLTPFSRGMGSMLADHLVSSRPKITVQRLKKGDTLVLASNGFKKANREDDIIGVLGKNYTVPVLGALAKEEHDKKLSPSTSVIVFEV